MTLTLRDIREQIVREHMESENRHEFDVTMGTFEHPRYEIIPTGEIHDGEEAVDGYFRETRAAFPDQRIEGEGLVCERVYFDTATILGQLGLVPGSV